MGYKAKCIDLRIGHHGDCRLSNAFAESGYEAVALNYGMVNSASQSFARRQARQATSRMETPSL